MGHAPIFGYETILIAPVVLKPQGCDFDCRYLPGHLVRFDRMALQIRDPPERRAGDADLASSHFFAKRGPSVGTAFKVVFGWLSIYLVHGKRDRNEAQRLPRAI